MSARRRTYVLAPEERLDLADILVYCERQRGRRQRGICKARLTAAMERLTRFPDLAPTRNDLPPGIRLHPVEQHVLHVSGR
jgi:plasmid stabilization system protein ParE